MSTIVVDHREQAPQLLALLREQYEFGVQIRQLQWGDYLIEPDTAVERKTTRDFLLSILDGRLFKQAYGLTHCEVLFYPVLLLEGPAFDCLDVDVALAAANGALVTLAQTFRLPVLRSADQEESAWYLARLHAQRRRLGQRAGGRHGYRPKRLQMQKLHILRALPGVGAKLAEQLLEHFGSVAAVMAASPTELASLKGIGSKKAQVIHHLLQS